MPSYTGTYPPFAYIVPGAAMRTQGTPAAALRAGRLVSALICLALLIAAVALTGGGVGAGAGSLVALTPMVVYCAAVLNASGPEIAGSLCFLAAGLRLQRPGAGPGAWVALAAGGAGAHALALARAGAADRAGRDAARCSPAGARGCRSTRGRRRPPARCCSSRSAVAAWWDLAEPAARRRGRAGYRDALAQSLHDLDDIARHAVGNFGALDTTAARLAPRRVGARRGGLFVLAAVRGSWRERAGLAACAVVALGLTLAVSVFQLRTGYGAQGRHVLPVLVLVPLWAGEVLRRRPAGLGWLPAAAGVLWATGQAVAWLASARRGAVGTDGSWWFFGDAEWSPPGSWWPWAVMAAAGAALGLAAAVAAVAELGEPLAVDAAEQRERAGEDDRADRHRQPQRLLAQRPHRRGHRAAAGSAAGERGERGQVAEVAVDEPARAREQHELAAERGPRRRLDPVGAARARCSARR